MLGILPMFTPSDQNGLSANPIFPSEPLAAFAETANVFVIVNQSRMLEDCKHLLAGAEESVGFFKNCPVSLLPPSLNDMSK